MFHSSNKLFDVFDNRFIQELGFHFGTRVQADNNFNRLDIMPNSQGHKIGYIYECELNLIRILDISIDLGKWDYEMIEEYFSPYANDYLELDNPHEWDSVNTIEDFIVFIQSKGYNGMKYINHYEGNGTDDREDEAFIIFNDYDITIKTIYTVVL